MTAVRSGIPMVMVVERDPDKESHGSACGAVEHIGRCMTTGRLVSNQPARYESAAFIQP
jgi:hypothetical protein